ncbi:DNA replication and repair protein RecF [Candidatus Saccharibacteria bacterium]|nr:DNA replication and repair protein RecF [Candidatus Saccharibacteria bacterium]
MLRHLHLSQFRSYSSLDLEFSEPVFLILGPNATGKTNILEAMYIIATGRSFRADDIEVIQHGTMGYRIDATFSDETISVVFQSDPIKRKRLLRESVAISRTKLLGLHPVVLFEPNDLTLLSGAPERRRRYLDSVLIQTDEAYRQNYVLYRRLLRQRNALLWRNRREPVDGLDDQLFILDTQIALPAENISVLRQKFLLTLHDTLSSSIQRIAQRSHEIEIEYIEKTSNYLERSVTNRLRDIALGTTSFGPHREDWFINLDHHHLNVHASRGEVRTTLLALKLAEIQYIREKLSGVTPLLLLDDVFSELDEARRRFLVNELTDVQTVITSTDIDKRLKLPAQTLDLTRQSLS